MQPSPQSARFYKNYKIEELVSHWVYGLRNAVYMVATSDIPIHFHKKTLCIRIRLKLHKLLGFGDVALSTNTPCSWKNGFNSSTFVCLWPKRKIWRGTLPYKAWNGELRWGIITQLNPMYFFSPFMRTTIDESTRIGFQGLVDNFELSIHLRM